MRTLLNCILVVPVERRSMGLDGANEKEKPRAVHWMGISIGLVEPAVGDGVPLGDLYLRVTERIQLSPGCALGREDLALVCLPMSGTAPSVNPKTGREDEPLELPKSTVVDPMVWHALLSAGFEEVTSRGKLFPDDLVRALAACFPLTQV